MRRHTASLTAAALTGIALLACGSSPVGSTIRGYSKAAPPVHDPSVLHGQYTAPPDRALLPVRAYANGPTPEGPTAQLRKELDAIDLSELPACTLEVQDYRPTERSGDDWAAELWATLSVDLTGLTTPTERMDRIDSCRAVVIPRTTRYAEPIDGTELERTLSLGPATLVIDEPEAHLDALLRRRAAEAALEAMSCGPAGNPAGRPPFMPNGPEPAQASPDR